MSELLSDRVAKNLMYIEAVADIDRSHWEVGRERRRELTSLQKKGQKKEVSEGGRVEGGRKEGGMREGERKGRGGWKDCLQLRCSFDLCTLSIWSRLKCCLNLAIVSWTDSPLTIPPVTWKVQHIMGV